VSESRVAVAVALGQFGNSRRELPQLEIDTRGLMNDSRLRRPSACYNELSNVRNRVRLWIVSKDCKSPKIQLPNQSPTSSVTLPHRSRHYYYYYDHQHYHQWLYSPSLGLYLFSVFTVYTVHRTLCTWNELDARSTQTLQWIVWCHVQETYFRRSTVSNIIS
jgi:hypothetical protein